MRWRQKEHVQFVVENSTMEKGLSMDPKLQRRRRSKEERVVLVKGLIGVWMAGNWDDDLRFPNPRTVSYWVNLRERERENF